MVEMSAILSYNEVFDKILTTYPQYYEDKNDKVLEEIFGTNLNDTLKCYIEAAIRKYLNGILKNTEVDLNEIIFIVEATIHGVNKEICLPTLPLHVLSDTFDCIPIERCEELFEYVEKRVSIWKQPLLFGACKTQVLRMCNDVLRRLSRTQNTIFCGRILLFLARFFPFSERSGLNLISEFNLENVTQFSTAEEETSMEVDAETSEDKKPNLDYTFYTKFWYLQDYFRNPIQCFQEEPWKKFTENCDTVLEAFSAFKLDSPQISKKNLNTPTKSEQADQFFPKYLSSKKLLDLQFCDSNFRRFILVQIIITGHYLLSNVKFKAASEVLNADQRQWVKQLLEKSFQLITETPTNGHKFASTLKCILKREELWNDWKNSGCPEIKKPSRFLKRSEPENKDQKTESSEATEPLKKRRKIGDVFREADLKGRYLMSNREMTRLWNICPDNFNACLQDCRNFVPTLEDYFLPAIEQVFSKNQDAIPNKLISDGNFGWRALRLLASKSPHFFTNSGNSIATLPEYLTNMVKEVAKGFPDLVNEIVKMEEEANENNKENDDDVAVIEQNEQTKDEAEAIEEPEETEREEEKLITADEKKKLATVLSRKGNDAWKILGKKIGFEDEELEYFSKEGKETLGAIEIMVERWYENEADDATPANITYSLGAVKMDDVAKKVFGEKEENNSV